MMSLCQQYGTGLIFSNEEDYKNIPLASALMMGTLPDRKDLSSWFPAAKYQGMQCSCVGWAVGYALKSYQEAVEIGQKPTDDTKTFSPSYIYNQIKMGDCTSGSSIEQALNLLRYEGVAKLSDFPYSEYNCNEKPEENIKLKARQYSIADWRRVEITKRIEVKSQIASNFPIVIGMYVDEGFEMLIGDAIYSGPSGRERGGHAMVVVGYDDAKSAYKVFNSWGSNWGNNGFGWISYSAFESRVREAYVAQDIVISDPNKIDDEYQPNNDVVIPNSYNPIDAILYQPTVLHNIPIQTLQGSFPGMVISVPGTIINGLGNSGQLIVRFYFSDGRPLFANFQEPIYRDANGLAATGTPVMPVLNNPADVGKIQLQIPYYALNLPPNYGRTQYNLAIVATLYINSFEKAKSSMTPIVVLF